MRALRHNDFWLGAGLSIFAIWYLSVAGNIRLGAGHPADLGPRMMPLVYGSLLLILSIALIIRTFMEVRGEQAEPKGGGFPLKSIWSAGLAIVYAFLIPRIGFVISSTALLLCTTKVMSEKKQNYWKLTLVYVIFSLAISWVFRRWFFVHFPEPLLDILGV